MRRLLALACLIVFVDTIFFAAITPLLPHFEDEFGLSKSASGVLAAAYPAGTFVGAIPGGYLAARAGVRATVLLGLTLMVVSSLGFAFADSIVALDAARFLQGIGGAASWAGRDGVGRERRAARPPRRDDRHDDGRGRRRRARRPGRRRARRRGRDHADVLRRRRPRHGAGAVGAAHAARRAEGTSSPRELLAALRDGRVSRRHVADRGARPDVRHDRRARAAAARRPRRRRRA